MMQQVIARLKWEHGLHYVVSAFKTNPVPRELATDLETGIVHGMTQNGVMIACLWLVRAIPWFPVGPRGQCAMVNQDLVLDLRDHLAEHLSMFGEELADWLLARRRKRCTPQLQAVLSVMAGEGTASREFAALQHGQLTCRSWPNE